ncbi:MAG: DUF58 domain-containing protein [Thermoguttaceae bacterium]|jgi:uncharacterized protein (DUF58 family)
MSLALDSRFLRRLERFEIIPRGIYRGNQLGHRRSPSRGTGLEFSDHKEYSIGDDIRYLDWNLYARLEELFVKLFEQEEAVTIHILLDASGSMSVGSPSKAQLGARIAAAVAYVGLANEDHVSVSLFADGLVASTKSLTGRRRVYEVLDFLDAPPQGATDLRKTLDSFSKATRRPGVVFVISDFLDVGGVLQGIRPLAGRKFGLYALHLVAPQELDVQISGDVELCDVETGRSLRQPLRRDTVERFRAFFRAHCEQLRSELRRYGVRYLRLATDQPLDDILFTRFPKEGVFR